MRNERARRLARKMLGIEGMRGMELKGTMEDLLDNTSDFVRRAGGKLVSRQVVAILITMWKQNNPGEDPVLVDKQQ